MKNVLTFISLILFSYTVNAQCVDPSLINPNGACTLEYLPVCGCDGKTYGNLCAATTYGGVTSYTYGECPITKTYTICEGESVQIGLDGFIGNTAMTWSPTNGLSCTSCPNPIASPTSSTIYELKIFTTIGFTTSYSYYEVIVDTNCPCICPDIYFPVCGSDGVTYSNECEAHCAGISEFYDGACSDTCENGSFFSSEYISTIGTDDEPQSTASDIYCFSASITNNICSWFWDFGNGTTSTEANPCNIYFPVISNAQPIQTPYEVCLTVFDCNNAPLGTCCEAFYPANFSSCYLPKDVGPCDGICPRWYYDASAQECLQFGYGCCGGNANNFATYEACIASCDCYDPTLIEPGLNCIALYDPVCGCDGVTYGNSCTATVHHGISSYTQGPCSCDYTNWYTEPACNSCIASVEIIEYNGNQYVAFWGDNVNCADALTTVYNCNGSVYCLDGGIVGNQTCGNLLDNYTTISTLWNQDQDCGSCDYSSWLVEPSCDDCISSVEEIEYNGNTYIAFWANDPFCADAMTIVYNCDGSQYCRQGGIIGFTECNPLIANYSVANTIWSKNEDCDPCGLPADPGICLAAFPRWYYNSSSGDCEQFTWGGCGGNANNFTSYEICKAACDCYDPTLIDPNINCIALYDPVCGCDGVTYSNSCTATFHGGITQFNPGPCSCDYASWYNEPTCNSCIASVEIIEYNGNQYVAFFGDNVNCADALTTVYNCDGSVYCLDGGIIGNQSCNSLLNNYYTVSTVWNQDANCPSCLTALHLGPVSLNGTYQAQETITSSGNVTAGGNTSLKAGTNVKLNSGFSVPQNCNFQVRIDVCD